MIIVFRRMRSARQLVTEQGRGKYRGGYIGECLLPGLTLNYCVKYSVRFYRAPVNNLIV